MKTRTSAIAASLALGAALSAQAAIDASSVSMTVANNKTAIITYRLTGDPAVVTLAIEQNDGNGNWSPIGVPVVSLTGDVNCLVQPDANNLKVIRWDAKTDWPEQSFPDYSIRAHVTAWAKGAPPDYMVLDLTNMEQRFYATTNNLPFGGLSNDHYRTNALVMRRIHAAGVPWVMGQGTNTSEAAACVAQSSPSSAGEHWVVLTNDYYMAVFETTQAQHRKLGASSSRSKDTADPRKPVDGISYLRLRMASTGTASNIDWPATGTAVGGDLAAIRTRTGIDFDVPTEAEWEFACRAGTLPAYYNGGEFTGTDTGTATLTDIAWYMKNRPVDGDIVNTDGRVGGLQVGGQKAPNAWGLYDMCGNASEWCKDYAAVYDTSVQPAVAPVGPATGTARIKRGGDWYSRGAHAASSARRSTTHIDYSVDDSSGAAVWANGYRLVCPAVARESAE